MFEIIAVCAAGSLIVILVVVWLKKVGLKSSPFKIGTQKIDLNKDAPQNPDAKEGQIDDPVLERSKLVVHALLQSVSASVESLLGDSSHYSGSLEKHKAGIKKAMTIAGIKELEKVMLAELEHMQAANSKYRLKLDEANLKLKDQKRELEKLQSDVGIDFLTRIPNRRSFESRITDEIGRTKRYDTKFSLVILDVDHFKSVNDVYGHLAGDRILRAIAHIMNDQKRETDFLARYGGEEFTILLPETSADEAAIMADKIRKKVSASKFRFEKKVIGVNISAGVGEVMPKGDTADNIFKRVDAALYRAKENGRNRIEMAAMPESEKK